MNSSFCRHRAEFFHERFQIQTIEILHDVIKGTIVGHAEVIELDRVLGLQGRSDLCFLFESTNNGRGQVSAPNACGFRRNKLDRGRSCKHSMFSAPHFSHAAFANRLDELVITHAASLAEIPSHSVNKTRKNDRPKTAEKVWNEHR